MASPAIYDSPQTVVAVKILITEERIRAGVERLSGEITAYYADRPLTIIGVLTGSIVFLADLIRQLNMPLRVGVVQASSYRGSSTTRGPLVLNWDLMPDIAGRDVLLVDDIFDTGHTLRETISLLDDMRPASIRSAVLLRKHGRREVNYDPDYVAFEIPDQFVVGYGLDYHDAFRDLPYLAALEPADLDTDPP
jgi:hypoxanthine phosphoribosyltransferase